MQRWMLAVGLWAAAWGAHASPTLKQAIESAWARQPAALADAARRGQFSASRDAAGSWIAGSPSLVLSQRTDRFNRDAGARELEAELEVALALPGVRQARLAVADSALSQYEATALTEKLRIAGEVRDAWWDARLAANELTLSQRKAADAGQLAADIERRYKAGDVARTDLNQAQGAARQAEAAAAEAEGKAFRALRIFASITGLKELPEAAESQGTLPASIDALVPLVANQRDIDTARARLSEAGADRRDPPSLALGTTRARSAFGEASEGSIILKLTIPFANQSRNRPKLAAANADLIEAEARMQLARAKVEADIAASAEELRQTTRQITLADARATLARDTHDLMSKAYRLGEIDLATRLRAESDRFDAELSLSRVRLEQGRAISRFNQATGLLP
ncbi:MAG: TolC family protein [Burkholderiales bacterium]|nr:TolC family protein [Burkholderiales bacterium]